jgi:hypothetical protein
VKTLTAKIIKNLNGRLWVEKLMNYGYEYQIENEVINENNELLGGFMSFKD